MSAMLLKIIAVITMLIDHAAASCFYQWGFGSDRIPFFDTSWYLAGRIIGRIAFPIYCFLIIEGVYHTKNWKKYGLRLLLLAFLSELPFDFCLHGLRISTARPDLVGQFFSKIDWYHQNVFFTLLLGMLVVVFLKYMREKKGCWHIVHKGLTKLGAGEATDGVMMILRLVLGSILALTLGWIAKHVLHTDYGCGGVIMISIMGLMYEPWEDWMGWMPRWIIRVVFCYLGLWACCEILNSSLEYYGMIALLPIACYNGKKGYSNHFLQYGFYFFYPIHLIVLGILKIYT